MASPVVDQGRAIALVAVAGLPVAVSAAIFAVALMVAMENMARALDSGGLAVKANILGALELAVLKEANIDKVPAFVAVVVVRDSHSTDCRYVACYYHCFQMDYVHSHVSFVGSKGYQSYVAIHPCSACKLLPGYLQGDTPTIHDMQEGCHIV